MQFTADEYFAASRERIMQAEELLSQSSSYALAIYCGGLSIECLLRAFRWQASTSFDGRHDLLELLKASRILRVNEESMRKKGQPEEVIEAATESFRETMNEIAALWNNNLRFAAESRLKTELHKMRRLQGHKGDAVKKNAQDFLNAARTLFDRGSVLWLSRKK